MKKLRIILTIALFVAISQSITAQYEKGILYLKYSDNSGEKGFSTFIYNSLPTPYKCIWELEDGSRWSVNYHEFDQSGNMVRKTRTFSDSIKLEQTYTYNENNQILSETFSRSDGRKGEVEYIYEKGLLVSANCKGLNGWFHGQIEYHYNSEQVKTSATLKDGDTALGLIKYAYDLWGRLDTETWIFDQGFSQTLTYSYQDNNCINYRSSNVFLATKCSKPIQKEMYDYSGQGGGPSYFEYEDGNRLVRKTYVRSDGLKTLTKYNYRPNGLLESSHREYADGKTGEFNYTYNTMEQLISRSFLRSDGLTSSENYTYDTHGMLTEGVYSNVDGWLTGKLIFYHDRYDRIQSADFMGQNGLSAKITFSYNSNSMLKQIHWEFNNDASQTYDFEY